MTVLRRAVHEYRSFTVFATYAFLQSFKFVYKCVNFNNYQFMYSAKKKVKSLPNRTNANHIQMYSLSDIFSCLLFYWEKKIVFANFDWIIRWFWHIFTDDSRTVSHKSDQNTIKMFSTSVYCVFNNNVNHARLCHK